MRDRSGSRSGSTQMGRAVFRRTEIFGTGRWALHLCRCRAGSELRLILLCFPAMLLEMTHVNARRSLGDGK
jgi:hypothetical protein